MALQAGLNKGGAAKGELILAIFELANCFRNGWGVDRDPVAAKQVRLFFPLFAFIILGRKSGVLSSVLKEGLRYLKSLGRK